MRNRRPVIQEVSLPRGAAGGPRLQLPLNMALLGCTPGALGVFRGLAFAIIGCGSVAGRIALLFTRLGVGRLVLVDPKNYRNGSLATHEVGPEDVGQPKALALARRCKAINPALHVQVFVGPVEELELAALADVDLVVMSPDNLPAEMTAGQYALWLQKPLAQASVHGPTLTVQIRFFGTASGNGGCPACGYGRAELEMMSKEAVFSCEGARGPAASSPDSTPATNSISAACSLAADLAVIMIARFVLNLGQPVENTMLEFNGFTGRTVLSPLGLDPKCPLEHRAFTRTTLVSPLPELSLAQMVQRATGGPVLANAQFEVAGLDWVEFAACGCAQPTPVRRFVARGRTQLGRCPKCAEPFAPLRFYTHRLASASVLGSAVERPLLKLGARRVSSVLLRTGDHGVLIRQQTPTQAAS